MIMEFMIKGGQQASNLADGDARVIRILWAYTSNLQS